MCICATTIATRTSSRQSNILIDSIRIDFFSLFYFKFLINPHFYFKLQTKIGRDFLEELKCLFLRVRDPPKSALEELVRKIVKCDLNSADGIEWLRLANRNFGDFRNKFIDGIERLINSFKERLERLVLFRKCL